jgi:glucan biosynthesis protein C
VQVILGFIVGSAILPIIHIAFLETSIKPIAVLLKSLATGLTAWLMFFGLVGTFLYYFNKPSAKVKYIADAYYWVYLFHLPFAYLFPGLLKEVDLSVWIKIPVSILATIIVCFFFYHFFVRGSFIGRILNGRY